MTSTRWNPTIRREGARVPNNPHVDIASDGAGYYAVWEAGGEIFGTRVAPDGTSLEDPPRSLGTGLAPVVTFDGGAYVVTWSQSLPGAGPPAGAISSSTMFGARVGTDGTTLDGVPIALGQLGSTRPAVADDGELVFARCGGAGVELIKVTTSATTPSTTVLGTLPLMCRGATVACISPRSCAVLTLSVQPGDPSTAPSCSVTGPCWTAALAVTTVTLDDLGAATAVTTEQLADGYADDFYGNEDWFTSWSISAQRTGPDSARRYAARWSRILWSWNSNWSPESDDVALIDPGKTPLVVASGAFARTPGAPVAELVFDGKQPAVLTVTDEVTRTALAPVVGALASPVVLVRADEVRWLTSSTPSSACAGPDSCMLGIFTGGKGPWASGVPRARPVGGPSKPARPLVWRSPQRQTGSAVAYMASSDRFLTAFWDHAESDPDYPSGALRVTGVDRDGAVLAPSAPVAQRDAFDALAAVGRSNDVFLAWARLGSVVGGFVSANGSMEGDAASLFAFDSATQLIELVAAGPTESGEMLVAALLRTLTGESAYPFLVQEIRAVRVGPTGAVLSPPVTLALASYGHCYDEWTDGFLSDLKIASSNTGFYVAWNDNVPASCDAAAVPHALGRAWHAGSPSPRALQLLGTVVSGLAATTEYFMVSADRLFGVSFTNEALEDDRASPARGDLLFDGSQAFMLSWDATSPGNADLVAVGPLQLDSTGVRLDLVSADGVQHASDGRGRTLLTYRRSSDSEARVMERLLVTGLPATSPDGGGGVDAATDAAPSAPAHNDGGAAAAASSDAQAAPELASAAPVASSPPPSFDVAELPRASQCTFAPVGACDTSGVFAISVALLAASAALRRGRRGRPSDSGQEPGAAAPAELSSRMHTRP